MREGMNGLGLYMLGRIFEQSITDYDAVLRLSPKEAAVYNDRGAAYSRKGDPRRAITDYSEAIRLNPKFALAYANRCRAYRTTGDLTRARQDRERAIQAGFHNYLTKPLTALTFIDDLVKLLIDIPQLADELNI